MSDMSHEDVFGADFSRAGINRAVDRALRQDFKPILWAIFGGLSPFVLIAIIGLLWVLHAAGAVSASELAYSVRPVNPLRHIAVFYGLIFFVVLNSLLVECIVLEFSRLRSENEQRVITTKELLRAVRVNFGRLIPVVFASVVLFQLHNLFCFVASIYLIVPLSLLPAAYILRPKLSFASAFGKAFSLAKAHWGLASTCLLRYQLIFGAFLSVLALAAIILTSHYSGISLAGEGGDSARLIRAAIAIFGVHAVFVIVKVPLTLCAVQVFRSLEAMGPASPEKFNSNHARL